MPTRSINLHITHLLPTIGNKNIKKCYITFLQSGMTIMTMEIENYYARNEMMNASGFFLILKFLHLLSLFFFSALKQITITKKYFFNVLLS